MTTYASDVVFIGNIENGPRNKMLNQIQLESKGNGLSTVIIEKPPEWRQVMSTARFNLAPRGFGRTSFRFAEIIQMGRVPVFLWDDVPWIPYAGTSIRIETFGLQQKEKPRYTNLAKRMELLKNKRHAEYKALEHGVKSVRHFYTYDGVMQQIERFIADPFDMRGKGSKTGLEGNYSRCATHPHSEWCCDVVAIEKKKSTNERILK